MLVSVWNRLSPGALPSSAVTPLSGRLPFSDNNVISPTTEDEDEIVTPLENGIDKIKDFILSSLPETLKPQSWVYKVSYAKWLYLTNRFTAHIVISSIKKLFRKSKQGQLFKSYGRNVRVYI